MSASRSPLNGIAEELSPTATNALYSIHGFVPCAGQELPMCRFVLYLGRPIHLSSLITEPENSLIHQSFDSHERDEPLNGDGFGVAWYAPEATADAALFRSITPAWSNQNLARLARAVKSPCVLAHQKAPSLHLHTGRLYSCRSGVPELIEANEDEHSVIVASEPLTDDPSWRDVPNNHIVIIGPNLKVAVRPINVATTLEP